MRRFNTPKTVHNESITVVKVDKSGGCVDRDETYLRQLRQAQIREYFFGDAKNTLSPHTQQIDFNQFAIYKLAECIAPFFLYVAFYDPVANFQKQQTHSSSHSCLATRLKKIPKLPCLIGSNRLRRCRMPSLLSYMLKPTTRKRTSEMRA